MLAQTGGNRIAVRPGHGPEQRLKKEKNRIL